MTPRATPGWQASLAVLTALALPSAATAESFVPPGNSAVDQYTESYPTVGGDKETPHGGRNPAQILGPEKARRLEAQGPAGQPTAALAAATAPRSAEASRGPVTGDGSGGAKGVPATGGGSGGAKGGGSATGSPNPSGSSGLGEVLGRATGLSSPGGPSALLPLVILATALWSLAYLWRRKRPTN
jgi:hypothetical protein